MLFEGGLVRRDAIQTAIEPVLVGDARIGVEQHIHGGLRKPFFMDGKLAARREQTVDGEQFEDFFPRHIAGLASERIAPEGVEAEFGPELCGGPAVAEAAGSLDGEGGELDLDDVGVIVQGGMYNGLMRALQGLGLADVWGTTRLPIYVLNVTYPLVQDEVAAFNRYSLALVAALSALAWMSA